MYVFSNVFAMVMDLISLAFAIFILGVQNRESLIGEHLYEALGVLYPQLLIILAASWFIRKRNVFSAKQLFVLVMEGERSALTKVIVLMISQFVLLAGLIIIQYSSDQHKPLIVSIVIFMIIIVSLYALALTLRLLIRTREQAVLATQEVYVDDINDMFTSIRGQRHDFLNHVQVIHTMAQMGKTEQLKSYVGELVKETRDVSEIVHHSSPALAAFVQAKLTVALGKGIVFTYELPDNWNVQQSSVRIIDIVKIMGNLVDNAFDEALLLPPDQRKVHASMQLQDNSILLEVVNEGRGLDDKEKEKIFISGYSTKGEGHSGLGLAIVMERIRHYRGEIAVESSDDGTTSFRINLPLREPVCSPRRVNKKTPYTLGRPRCRVARRLKFTGLASFPHTASARWRKPGNNRARRSSAS
ncbi:hypothetical protein SD71_11885 [Cohnella kolymensis]|uniref:histidine kinase n=1 Tax=Cohnella kolymensis TaxID=1590652 RepID=A0ABR5A4N6_9BACL|nr:ATP-binding protein [Cohnella kolymensis]KIL36015.1 hypothetical protein SD71_11885 [Cohnella kolymensis]